MLDLRSFPKCNIRDLYYIFRSAFVEYAWTPDINFNNNVIRENKCAQSRFFFDNNFEDNSFCSLFFNIEISRRIKSADKCERTTEFYINYCSTVRFAVIGHAKISSKLMAEIIALHFPASAFAGSKFEVAVKMLREALTLINGRMERTSAEKSTHSSARELIPVRLLLNYITATF